jgi:tetratricopeptide (TPR) repeat protein
MKGELVLLMRLNKLLIAACLTIACTPAAYSSSLDDSVFRLKSTQPAAGAFARTVKGINTTNDSESRGLIEVANAKIAKEPNNDKYFAARAQLHRDLGEYTEAISDISRAIQLNPNSQIYFEFRGTVKAILKDYAAGVKDLDSALSVGPPSYELLVKRASALAVVDRYSDSLKDCDTAIAMSPSSAEAYAVRGLSYYFMHNHQRALADCQKALSLNPGDATAIGLRNSLSKTGQW